VQAVAGQDDNTDWRNRGKLAKRTATAGLPPMSAQLLVTAIQDDWAAPVGVGPDQVLEQYFNFNYDLNLDHWSVETYGYPETSQNSTKEFDFCGSGDFSNNTTIVWPVIGNQFYAVSELIDGITDCWMMSVLVAQFPSPPVDYEFPALDQNYIWADIPQA
jgi:hypothetical protein